MLKKLVSDLIRSRRADPAGRAAAVRAALEAGVEHARAGRAQAAEPYFLEALRLEPRNPDALNLLGMLAFDRMHYDTALDYFRAALRGDDRIANFHLNLGRALQALGDDDEAETAFRRAVALEPESLNFAAALLFHLSQRSGAAPEMLLAEHRACVGRLFAAERPLPVRPAQLADPERRLRVAYLSGDFRAHAVAYFVMPLLAARDRERFEVVCYHTLAEEDERTAEMRALADRWQPVHALSDDALAALIHADAVDILVDLAGLTLGHRMRVLARRPAPVQVSYLGYLGTTGLDALAYRITDARADPPGADRWYSETLVRLPDTFWCFQPHPAMPDPIAPADRGDGPIVFGSFNRLAKVRPEMLRLWGRVLAQVPGSELWFADVPSDEAHRRLAERLAEAGVAADRVKTWGRLPPQPYWDLIRRADIALDTFPYNGGATTCECLWLGVPVVTRAGAMGFARSGASILGGIGLPELVAESDEDYVAAAVALATDRARLRAIQGGLRERMRRSPLLDAPRFMAQLEGAYRSLWRQACAAAVAG